jgi:hypothetical protein
MFAGKFVNRGVVPDDKIIGEAAMLYEFDHPGLVKGYGIGLPASRDSERAGLDFDGADARAGRCREI